MHVRHFLTISLLAGLSLAPASGCQRHEEIRRYRVLKPEALAEINKNEVPASRPPKDEPPSDHAPTDRDRMLGAIVPREESVWFFKFAGPKDVVAGKAEEFLSFLKSVKFSADTSKPEWTLPEGWIQKPGNEMRFATINVPTGTKPLELTVFAFPKKPHVDDATAILENVNRWRGQLQLPPIQPAEVADQTRQVELEGATATIVNLVGEMAPNSMGQPPFSQRGR